MDELLPVFSQNGIGVVLDLHTPPGGFSTRSGLPVHRLFHSAWAETCFVDVWKVLARRYKGNTAVWGFDILNEPATGGDLYAAKWRTLAARTAQAVEAIDSARRIIVESPYGDPRRFGQLQKIAVRNAIYSFHMYAPLQFTHQGVDRFPLGLSYPGVIAGRQWDAATIAAWLQPVVNWQKANNARIYAGEFSAVCYASGNSSYRYLSDVISFFEKQGWNWTYHAFREWNGWSVEHTGTGPNAIVPATAPTDRQLLLRSWFARNP